jgi:hypothetical protein
VNAADLVSSPLIHNIRATSKTIMTNTNSTLKLTDLFKTIGLGWTIDATVIFWPIILVALIVILITGSKVEGEPTTAIWVLFLTPIIAAVQSIFVTLIVFFGLVIYKKIFRKNR